MDEELMKSLTEEVTGLSDEGCNCDQALALIDEVTRLRSQRDALQHKGTTLLERARKAEAQVARYKRMFGDRSGRWDSEI